MSTRPIVWRYIAGGQRKHAFYEPPRIASRGSARCGTGPHWSDPRGWLGARGDEVARLESLRPCARCLDNLKRDRGPS